MKILKEGKSAGGVDMQIEEWNENYSFMPYGSTLAFYPGSKATHKGPFAPKAGESYTGGFWLNNEGERLPIVAGSCRYTSNAGSSALSVSDPRSHVAADLGFFSAFLEL